MPKFRDWIASRTAATLVDDDELYVRDASGNVSQRGTFAGLKTALGSLFAPINNPTFTGNVVVPTADASGEAVNKAQMDTADGLRVAASTLTTDGDILTRAAGVPARVTRASLAADAAFTAQFAPIANPTFTGNVVVPAGNAANEAAQITAFDATTGRLAIGGYEIGDSGYRSVSSTLESFLTAVSAAGRIRRTGNVVFFAITSQSAVTKTFTTGAWELLYTLPSGFRPEEPTMDQLVTGAFEAGTTPPRAGLRGGNPSVLGSATNPRIYFAGTWTTRDAWPASLPGTAV